MEFVGGKHIAFGLVVRDGGGAANFLACGYILGDAAVGHGLHSVSDGDMSGDPDFSSQHDIIAHGDRPGDPGEGDEEAVFADGGAVTDGDEVGKFCTLADAGFAHGGPLDGAPRPYFDIVFDDDDAGLGNFVMRPFMGDIAKPILANDHGTMQDDPVTYDALFIDRNIGMEDAVITDASVHTDIDSRIEHSVCSDARSGFDGNEGVNVGGGGDGGGFVDGGAGADGGGGRGIHDGRWFSIAIQLDQGISIGEIGILGDEAG